LTSEDVKHLNAAWVSSHGATDMSVFADILNEAAWSHT